MTLRGRVLLAGPPDGDGIAGWSLSAAEPDAELEVRGDRIALRGAGGQTRWRGTGDPLEVLEGMSREYPLGVGWIGYEIGRRLHGLAPRPAPGAEPDLWFGFWGQATGPQPLDSEGVLEASALFGLDDGDLEAYRRGFARVQDYLLAGDCYQVNLARQLRAPVAQPVDPVALFRRIARRSPAAYAAVIDPGDGWSIVSVSPERFLHRAPGSDRVETRPIKGTRRRTGDPAEDARLAAELAADPKERAEHLMIVDLERNDLGRVARTGTVSVDSFARVVSLPTVLHLVSTVSCRTSAGVGDLLRATFPGGSITGAPKRRAMQIIDELEPFARGAYTGAFGTLTRAGGLDLAIAIRTAVVSPAEIRVAVGGGVVADSTLERELEETEEKAAAWRAALR
ncbi:MAG TPA: anthranilate synthase component I family protein [Kofleriaceae bacterium]|nr:anthranilate synthase component I family protein [Kofleriaceae bacterium]